VIDFALFHFLRPGWLLLLLPATLLVWSILRRQDSAHQWRGLITPVLLGHLLLRDEEKRGHIRPSHLLALAWFLGIIALSGPSWEKEPLPFTEDTAALFIVLKVTPEMLAQDIQPSRLQRAVQKIGDLLALRPGSKAGLIAYAGSAHLVMPLTSDAEIIRDFAAELAPDVMPETGDEPLKAIELAGRYLQNSGLPGSIVLISDYIDPGLQEGLAAIHAEGGADVHIYAMAAGPEVVPPPGSPPAPALDLDSMRAAADAAGGDLTLPSADGTDVRQLSARIERSLARAPAQEGERWNDAGYPLLPVILLLALFFFRSGGAVDMQR